VPKNIDYYQRLFTYMGDLSFAMRDLEKAGKIGS